MTKQQLTHEEELEQAIREIRERVQARYPTGMWDGLELPDFTPVLEARDQASAKVASIGTVNPRPGGPINAAIQSVKRSISRGLGWFVRDQVDFNHAMVRSLDSVLEGLNAVNRTLKTLPPRFEPPMQQLRHEAEELKDIRSTWHIWRKEWEDKLSRSEVQLLRAVSDLQAAYQQRTAVLEQNYALTLEATVKGFEERLDKQHREFKADLAKASDDLHQQFWREQQAGLEAVRLEYEKVIHHEMKAMRQKQIAPLVAAPAAAAEPALDIDWVHFANKFRGDAAKIQQHFATYVPAFAGCRRVLDIGCGRGEFLALLKENNIPAKGVDLYPNNVSICQMQGLDAQVADAFDVLENEGPGAFDGIFCAQVIEHLPPAQVWKLVQACSKALRSGGVVAFETPNPECLAIFATHFFIDPSHQRPIPPALLAFYLEEADFGRIQITRFAPAFEERPELQALPASVKEGFFGGLDYSAVARKI